MRRCRGKTALVTGAGQGIGRAIAVALAREGADVVVNDLPPSTGSPATPGMADQTVAEVQSMGRDALLCRADVGDRSQVEQMFKEIADRFGRVDIVVANAATNVKEPLVETDWPTVRRIMDVTLCGVFHVCQIAARQMIEQADRGRPGGKILITGSIHAKVTLPYHGAYAMCKSAGNQFCKSLAAELIPYRINVNAVNPGWIDTPGERNYLSESQLQAVARQLPWGRLGTAVEVAELFVYLASDAADYITGSVFDIDGGLALMSSELTTGLDE